jgi:hypothetical protein
MVTLRGGCLCGAVRYETEAEPIFAGLCHCRDCLKATGSNGAPYMGFRIADVRTTGTTQRYTNIADSGAPTSRLFCLTCSTIVFGDGGESDTSGIITLYAGTLDDPSLFQPREIIFARSRPYWAVAMDHLPTYETAPPQ